MEQSCALLRRTTAQLHIAVSLQGFGARHFNTHRQASVAARVRGKIRFTSKYWWSLHTFPSNQSHSLAELGPVAVTRLGAPPQ